MKVLNYGSLNVDYVYSVDHIIVGGETQHSSKLEVFSGGKGLNQSIALAKAGVPVYHAGIVGTDGDILLDACKEAGVNTKYIRRLPVKGGHTMIQVDKNAQNCIILYGGTNQMQTKEFVDEVLADFGEGDYLILQNEINMLDYIIDQAYEKKKIPVIWERFTCSCLMRLRVSRLPGTRIKTAFWMQWQRSSRMHALFSIWEAMVLFTMMEKKKCFRIFLR